MGIVIICIPLLWQLVHGMVKSLKLDRPTKGRLFQSLAHMGIVDTFTRKTPTWIYTLGKQMSIAPHPQQVALWMHSVFDNPVVLHHRL